MYCNILWSMWVSEWDFSKFRVTVIYQTLSHKFVVFFIISDVLVKSIICRMLYSTPEAEAVRIIVERGGLRIFSQEKPSPNMNTSNSSFFPLNSRVSLQDESLHPADCQVSEIKQVCKRASVIATQLFLSLKDLTLRYKEDG